MIYCEDYNFVAARFLMDLQYMGTQMMLNEHNLKNNYMAKP